MATTDADLTIEILRRIQADLAAHRQDTRTIQQSFVDLARVVQRLDARMSDTKADLETMFKMELMGQLAHHETRIEHLLAERIDALIARIEAAEAKPTG